MGSFIIKTASSKKCSVTTPGVINVYQCVCKARLHPGVRIGPIKVARFTISDTRCYGLSRLLILV